MENIAIIFAIITGSLSFFASIGQLLIKERRFENYNLFAVFLMLAFLQGQSALIFSKTVLNHPELFIFHATILCIMGVVLYFAFLSVSLQKERVSGKKIFLFIPSFLILPLDVYYISIPAMEKSKIIGGLFYGDSLAIALYFKIAIIGSAVQLIIFMVNIIIKIKKCLIDGITVKLPGTIVAYTVLIIFTMGLVIVGHITSVLNFLIIASIMLGLILIGILLISRRHPEFIQIILLPSTQNRYIRSKLTSIDLDDLYQRFMYLLNVDKIYSSENITLTDCADELDVTHHQLSEFINEKLKCSFFTLINQYRIQEATRMLVDEPDRTILSIAHAVGFNSKFSFYNSFSRFIGVTPKQYRSMHINKNSINR